MSNEIYFSGFRLEHYTGWNGTGTPSYGTVSLTNTNNYNSVGDISLNSSSNILWGAINDTDYNPIYFMMCGGILPTFVTSTNTYNSYITDGTNILGFSISNNSSSTNMTLTIFDGTYDSNTNVVTQGNTIYTTSGSLAGYPICTSALYFKLSSNSGSSYDTLDVYYNSYGATSSSYPFSSPVKIVNSFSLNNFISHITGIFHTCSISSTSGSLPSCICDVVANYDLSGGYLDWTTGKAVGTISGWTGDVSPFQTYPVQYMISPQYTNGYSGYYYVTIPNYLNSGTGFSMVFYNDTLTQSYSLMTSQNWLANPGVQFVLNLEGTGTFNYRQYNGSWHNFNNNNLKIGWNIVTIFNDSGTLHLNLNGTELTSTKIVSNTTTLQLLPYDSSVPFVIASAAITTSSSVSYPFDKDSNVTSYIDFYDPNNPVVYGDTTQIVLTSQSLTTTTSIADIPEVRINSEVDLPTISTSGQYSYTPGTSISYTQTKSLNYGNSFDATMIISSPMITDGSASVSPFVYKNSYTNGYSGTYTISVPNYLASGTGLSFVFWMSSTQTGAGNLYYNPASGAQGCPAININQWVGAYSKGTAEIFPGYAGTRTQLLNCIIDNSWNRATIFNNNGVITYYINDKSVSFTSYVKINPIIINFGGYNSGIIASMAYINSSTVPSYPFDEASNVVSYIDFYDPNNPVVYGDQTQLSVTSKSLTSGTTLPNVPSIKINSENDVSNYYTGEDVLSLSTTGSAETFYFYNDPFTNKRWDTSSISSYQFGITKVT